MGLSLKTNPHTMRQTKISQLFLTGWQGSRFHSGKKGERNVRLQERELEKLEDYSIDTMQLLILWELVEL